MPSREPELYKDKIEVNLDGRQIFYLFFGGAVIVGLVFVLGVMVGRRVEARGHLDRAQAQAASDPLAALDRLERSDNLSFHGALTGGEAPTDVEKAIGELESHRTAGKADAKPAPVASLPAGGDPKPAKPDAKKPDDDKRADKADKPDKPVTHPEADAKADKPKAGDGKGRFTLQLSAFQDKAEAEAFVTAMKSAGYQPYLTTADAGSKGTLYRVRLGAYRSLDAASDAKAEYERAAKRTAQVTRL